MDWLHCNRCFRRSRQNFVLSSCGHICCERCVNPKQCIVCGASCNYLPITDQMKPQEQVFFMDPVKLIQSRLEHITQIALFQQRQKERVTAFFRHKSVAIERRLKDITEQCDRQISELKRQNSELKKPLSQRWVSPGLAVTSPVVPRSRNMSIPGSAESQERARVPRLSLTVTPGSATSISSSLHERRYITPQLQSMSIPGSAESQERARVPRLSLTTPGSAASTSSSLYERGSITRRSQNMSIPGSAESQERARVPRLSLTLPQTPPGSAVSIASSLHGRGSRTPASLITPTRTLHLPPNIFQFQRMDRH